MATLIRNPATSAVSTDRLRTCRRSTSGSEYVSSYGIQSASSATAPTAIPSERGEVHPHPPPSLSTTEMPMTTRLSMPAPTVSNRRGTTSDPGGRTNAASTSAAPTVMAPNQ